MPKIPRPRDNGPLRELLIEACPPDKTGHKSIAILARSFSPPLTAWAVHKWIKKGKIPPKRAFDIVQMSPGRIALARFQPFI